MRVLSPLASHPPACSTVPHSLWVCQPVGPTRMSRYKEGPFRYVSAGLWNRGTSSQHVAVHGILPVLLPRNSVTSLEIFGDSPLQGDKLCKVGMKILKPPLFLSLKNRRSGPVKSASRVHHNPSPSIWANQHVESGKGTVYGTWGAWGLRPNAYLLYKRKQTENLLKPCFHQSTAHWFFWCLCLLMFTKFFQNFFLYFVVHFHDPNFTQRHQIVTVSLSKMSISNLGSSKVPWCDPRALHVVVVPRVPPDVHGRCPAAPGRWLEGPFGWKGSTKFVLIFSETSEASGSAF